jgi:predicted Zn-dependent protease
MAMKGAMFPRRDKAGARNAGFTADRPAVVIIPSLSARLGAALSPQLQACFRAACHGTGAERHPELEVRLPSTTLARRPGLKVATFGLAVLTALPLPAFAQKGLPLVRDAEIEELLRDYARPIFRAAGIPSSAVEINIINNRAFNAFVANGRRMFINVGAIFESETPNELIGVMAHETGHIAGGHLARLREQLERAQTMAIVAMLLGAGAMAGGAATGSGEGVQAGRAIMLGGQNAAGRSLLSYQRGEEQAADRAALNYLQDTGQSARGMLRTFERFANEGMFLSRGADPYAMSHPMPRERIAALEDLARKSVHFEKKDPPALQLRHDLARAKVAGFLDRHDTVARRYPLSDTSLPARYARAIAAYKGSDPKRGIELIDELIAAQPSNAYFWELKGQALVETGRPREAIPALRKAVSLAPSQGLIRLSLGQALVVTDDRSLVDEAISELRRGLSLEPEAGGGYRHLSRAYAVKGNIAEAELAAARGYFLDGEYPLAKSQAARAQAKLPRGSPGWIAADDILNFKQPRVRR